MECDDKMSPPSPISSDAAILSTADDASVCKKAAVLKGYWQDDFITHMVHHNPRRKEPEINRGYYARTEGIWCLLKNFVQLTNKACQIVSFGAGLDTTYWRLHGCDLAPQSYVEVDFAEMVQKKIHIISSSPHLRSHLSEAVRQEDIHQIHSTSYHLVGCDLRDLKNLKEKLAHCGLDSRLPTLLLTECVLVYMSPEASNALIRWSAVTFDNAAFVNYEPVNMNDAFGAVMVNNLKARDCWLVGASECTSVRGQEQRFRSLGWPLVTSRTMWDIYNGLPDRSRIERLEFLDEAELLQQLLDHYCLCIAVKDSADIGLDRLCL